MTPNQSAGGLNIDQMLQNLQQIPASSPVEKAIVEPPVVQSPVVEQVPAVSSVPAVGMSSEPVQTNNPVSTFTVPGVISSIPVETTSFSTEGLQGPVVASAVPTTTTPKPSKKFNIPSWLRVVGSAVGTLLFLLLAAWILSVQYPEETKTLLNGVTGTFSTLAGVASNNANPDGIVAVDSTNSEDQTHGVADNNYVMDAPLADALDQASQQLTEQNQAEQTLESVFGSGGDTSNSVQFDQSSGGTTDSQITNSGTTDNNSLISTHDANFNLPTSNTIPTVAEFQSQLLDLSQKAQTAMNGVIGNNNVSLAKMRVIYKNVDTMLSEVSNNGKVIQEQVDQLKELQTLYDSVVQ